ncbi:hypothetical protein [Nocardioides piscis]|uniref:Uncharacterized protein n=1 Tax=Nocardioides piscis TaxID=2714938 RepID=A0A6G7YCS5_9ACTN|nr:hypothetical protein [Nocardioides piscis]QIK74451.1 hypothetical protein G7071_02340 [Nocardioides piscis]
MPVDQSLVGREFPPTPAVEVTADAVDAFARALGASSTGAACPRPIRS